MGNCSSCLGVRRRESYDDDDESRLLFDDADGTHYGSFGEAMTDGDDVQESQRENEALQSIVARTSDNMIDVFEIAPRRTTPRGRPSPYAAYNITDNRSVQFQHLLSKLSVTDDTDPDARLEESVQAETVPRQYHNLLPTQANVAGPFVGNFADATQAEL